MKKYIYKYWFWNKYNNDFWVLVMWGYRYVNWYDCGNYFKMYMYIKILFYNF